MTRLILIVNGSPDRRHKNRDLLDRAGYDAREIISMDAAIDLARSSPPAAVLLEAPHNVDSVTRFVGRLRSHPTTQTIPIVLLSEAAESLEPLPLHPRVTRLGEPTPSRTLLEEIAYLTRPPPTVPPAAPYWRGG